MSRIASATSRSIPAVLVMLAGSLLLLQACGGGGGGGAAPPPVIPDSPGYYGNTGTLTLTQPALNITDLQAMITSTRLIMASKAQGYYYDGPIVVSGNTITGNLVVQFITPGENNDTATLTATINPDRSISGTVTHSADNLANPFTLYFATGRTDSTVAAIATTQANPSWVGTLYTVLNDFLTFSLADNTAGAVAITTITPLTTINTAFRNCMFTGTLTPIGGTSLYEVSFTASNACADLSSRGGPYTGLAALRTQTNPNDTLVIASHYFDTVGYRALFGEFQ